MVTEINDHRDKWSSETLASKQLKGLNNNITQTKIMESIVLVYVHMYAAYDIRRAICDSDFFPSHLACVHMYAAYDIRRPICDSEFFPSSHLCLVVYMCPTPICDIRRPMCDSDFFDLGPKKSDDK